MLMPQMPIAWIDLEYMPGWKAALIWAALALPIVLLGMRSLAGMGPVRKWVAISLRLMVLLMLVLILGGARWQRVHKDVQVMVVRDNSQSTMHVRGYPGKNLDESLEDYLRAASGPNFKQQDDRIGVISFDRTPLIDSMPNKTLLLDARAIREKGSASDMASAIQLALATFQKDAMRRILLISDGNQTAGDLEGALSAAVSQGVPIDVMKLSYNVNNEVLIDRLSAPSWKRESDAFDIFVSLISTNPEPVTGTLTITEENQRLEQRKITIAPATMNVDGKIEPRKHVERVRVPALRSSGVRRFKSQFDPDVVNSRVAMATQPSKTGDTLLENNTASAFTFVSGQGKVLYVDNTKEGLGKVLEEALRSENVNVETMNVDQVPEDLVALQNYDAIILNNVPHGRTPTAGSGLSDKHDAVIASYVHDFGGGLIMVGGPDSFGAGGWQGTKIEEVLPLNMDIPAQRQMPKGALVVVIHSCEMPDGNYWGEQCAIKAVETLSAQDEIGVISYGWGGGGGNRGGGIGGSSWDYALAPKGDGSRVIAAIKRMQPGDMPSFDDCLELAVNGVPGGPSLRNSNAAQKHVIIISDGDPQQPQQKLMQQIIAAKISISTVSVYPHQGNVPPTMEQIARATGGRFYGPVEKNPNQLPQIFIKEATVVRRTLLQESRNPAINVTLRDNSSDIMKNIPPPPPIYGMVLSSKKVNPTIEMPLVASLDGKNIDPLFAHWQAGLGKAAAFTSDGSPVWDERWLSPQYAGAYGKFWSQMVRGVSRPPMSTDYSTTTERIGDRARVTVEVTNKESGFTSFLNVRGVVVDPEGNKHEVRLTQSGPGTYVTDYPVNMPGNYVVILNATGPDKKGGYVVSGLAVNDSPETRELKSNDALLEEIATRSGGRVMEAFSPESANLFSREGLKRSASPLPVWDILIPILLALVLIDVAARRIAWDWLSTKRMALALADRVRSFTVARQIEAKPTLDALKRVRDEVQEAKFKTGDSAAPLPSQRPPPVPNRAAKFEAKGVEGDITEVVGGASNKPIPAAPKKTEKAGAGAGAGYTGSLLEAKRRAQQKIKEKEQGEE
jgi:uncharacterized membrane protein